MQGEIMKHQSIINVCDKFITSLKQRFNNNINTQQYIVERLVNENICVGFSGRMGKENKLINYVDTHKHFGIISHKYENAAALGALTYSTVNNKPAVIFSNCEEGYLSLSKPLYRGFIKQKPIIVLSTYEMSNKSKDNYICNFTKESVDVKDNYRFPHLIEYMLMLSKIHKPGPVHLNLEKKILEQTIDLNDVGYSPIQDNEKYPLKEDAYQEKLLDIIEPYL